MQWDILSSAFQYNPSILLFGFECVNGGAGRGGCLKKENKFIYGKVLRTYNYLVNNISSNKI